MASPTKVRLSVSVAFAALVITVASVALAACPAHAASARDSKFQPTLEATVRYLQSTQREDGGFAEQGREPEPDLSAWVTLALAAAGINPRDQTTAKQHYQAGHSAFSYLGEHAHELSLTTDFARDLLVVDAAGTSPYDFGGVNLVGELLARQITQGNQAGGFAHEEGSTEAGVNDTVFAILALSPIREQRVQEAVGRAADWLEAQQHCDGGWPAVAPRPRSARSCGKEGQLLSGEGPGELDMTGAAIQALVAAGHPGFQRENEAFEFLQKAEDTDGGFPEFPGGTEPNVASTAWAVQAMWSAGINPETWSTESPLPPDEPLGYLASMQQTDGHIRYEASVEMNGMWMTAYVGPALSGDFWPIPQATYEPLPALPPEGPGEGPGVGRGSSEGVIVGGGGEGAPLFSRPKPKSKGHSPGGIRRLKSQAHERPHARQRNPRPIRKQPAPAVVRTTGSKAHVSQTHASKKRLRTGVSKRGDASKGGNGTEVNGVLIGNPKATNVDDRLQSGAPGLRSASGGEQSQGLTTAIYAAIAALILAGALVEHRRPQTTI